MESRGYIPPAPLQRVREAARDQGPGRVLAHVVRWGGSYVAGMPWARSPERREFTFRGRTYPYLFHSYKHAWLTERAVEVPVLQRILEDYSGKRILEVGNVLAHYGAVDHVVVDKYETAPGVLNLDVLELGELGQFDLIVAISTLEHVGRDEEPRDADKAVRATLGLRDLLAPGGQLVITVPAGYNPALDEGLRSGAIPTRAMAAMARVGEGRRWRETSPAEAWSTSYDFLLYAARGVVFGFLDGHSA